MEPNASWSFYKSLFDNMLDGLAYCQMIYDAKKNPIDIIYIDVNKIYKKIRGVKSPTGKKVSEVMPDFIPNNPELFQMYNRVSLTGKPERSETFIKPDSKWYSISVYSFKKDFFLAVFQDITFRINTDQYLQDVNDAIQNVLEDLQEEKLGEEIAEAKDKATLLSIGDGLIATDEKGYITCVNLEAEKLIGWKKGEVLGKEFLKVLFIENEKGQPIPIEKRPAHMALLGRPSNGTTTSSIIRSAYYYVRTNGTRFPVSIKVRPIILNNKIIGTIEVFRNTEREREVDKAKTEFVSLASHQLRTPLTMISWYTEMILKGDVGKVVPSQKKYLEEIYYGNKRMIELVNTLLDVSRIELGTLPVRLNPTDIIALTQTILAEQKPQIEKKRHSIIKRFAKNIPVMTTDRQLLKIIIQNLMSNSVEYTAPGGKIEIAISFDDKKGDILIQVSDNGYGIPENQQSKIFTKLFRADNVRAKDTDGTGLGLYIVKSIVNNFGGKIWFKSQENKGSTFYVSLPLNSAKKKK